MKRKQEKNSEKLITDLLKSGQIAQAEKILVARGGALYPLYYGYRSLERILESAPDEAHLTSEVFLGAFCFLLAKQGRARRARALLRDTKISPGKTFLFDLVELLIVIRLGEDLSDEQVAGWSRLEGQLPLDQPLYEGLYYNSMLVIMVRLNRFTEAHAIAALAIESYSRAKNPHLVHYIHLHLADLAIVEGDIKNARRHARLAEAFLAESGITSGNDRQLIQIVWLSIDFELGKLDGISQRATEIRRELEKGDSWAEIFIQVCRIGTMSTYYSSGRGAAVVYLEECQTSFYRCHGEFSNSLDVILAHIYLLEGQIELAQQLLQTAKEQGLFSAIGSVMSDTINDRIDPLAASGLPNSCLRCKIARELVKASAAKIEKQPAAMRHHVESAMRLAVNQGLISIFVEHRDVVIKVSAKLATGTFARGHVQLARMAKKIHKLVQTSYVMPASYSRLNITIHQMRVLSALKNGATNKQIARNLGVTEATVKYHLHNLFRIFRVSKRGQLIETIELNG